MNSIGMSAMHGSPRIIAWRRLTTVLLGSTCLGSAFVASPAQAADCTPLANFATSGSIVQASDQLSVEIYGGNGGVGSIEGDDGDNAPTAPGVTLLNCTTLSITSTISASSTGGHGGNGNSAVAPVTPGTGGRGGDGGIVVVENLAGGVIDGWTGGMSAISRGGDGGSGGGADTFGSGADGGNGGNGGDIYIVNNGSVSTLFDYAPAIYALTEGGQAGRGGSGGWFSGHGGDGGSGGNSGSDIIAENSGTVVTSGGNSAGMALQSIGGNGGYGGSDDGLFFALGGKGGPGGLGGQINAINTGTITTTGRNSKGISALSLGGGGGDGGNAFAAGLVFGIAIGGSGGYGGDAGLVEVFNGGNISTSGYGAIGISAKSIGGGGGDGGSASAVAVGTNFAFTFAMGGSGGNGGDGGLVDVNHGSGNADASITTGVGDLDDLDVTPGLILPGDFATGILAQSIGGGGGNGHQAFTLSAAASDEVSLAVSVGLGGSGGDGGDGGEVDLQSNGSIATNGRFATGVLLQSIGGGGGNGGNTMSIDAAVGNIAGTLAINLAGSGGGGGSGGMIDAVVYGDVTTIGLLSSGVVAQSIGGGGGNGGNTFDTSATIGDISVNLGASLGGSGGAGSQGGTVISTLESSGSVNTYGDLATGLLAQSIGGGGGNGGSVQTYAVSLQGGEGAAANATVNVGGSAGNGGRGGVVTQTVDGAIETHGVLSIGAAAQSIGGGGGNGGHVFALDIAASLDSDIDRTEGRAIQASVNIGGSGGTGADGENVTLNFGGSIETSGALSTGALVQSIGGGGGNGGSVHSFSIATALPNSLAGLGNRVADSITTAFGKHFDSNTNLNLTIDVGGSAGGGGSGGDASALLTGGSIQTSGNHASGLVVQSFGGGGGNGGSAVANGFIGMSSIGADISVGGHGGAGASAGNVTIRNVADVGATVISTSGDHSYGVHAQSIGGGGGTGGLTHAMQYAVKKLSGLNLTVGVGGHGGIGNVGGDVLVRDVTALTSGANAYGIVAQSIGGGGGSGGASDGSGGIQITLGGDGGSGNHGGTVEIATSEAQTTGTGAVGVLAQSIGGGGGNAGVASTGSWVTSAVQALGSDLGFDVSGSGGNGGNVNIGCVTTPFSSEDPCSITATTTGDAAVGILAQSIGGGGGLVQVSNASIGPINFTISGSTPGTGSSGRVSIVSHYEYPRGNVSTTGDGAIGILAQSIDSGGGAFILDSTPQFAMNDLDISGSVAGNGGVLVDLSTQVTTAGDHAVGILAQSLSNAYLLITPGGRTTYGYAAYGASNNNASSNITLRLGSSIQTSGANAHGLMVETGSARSASNENNPNLSEDYTGYGSARAQTIDLAGNISVTGEDAWAVYSANPFDGTVADDQFTTHILVEDTGSISSGENSAGGMYVFDDGNIALDIYGTVEAQNGPALSVRAANQLDVNIEQYAYVAGDVGLTVDNGASGTIALNLNGSVAGAVIMTSNGGHLEIDAQNGSIDNGMFATAISIDTTDADLTLGDVRGNIFGSAITDTAQLASLTSMGTINGTIGGAFDYRFGSSDSAHILNVSGTGGSSDRIDVGAYQAGGPSGHVTINLTELPSASFEAYDIITVAAGMPSSGTAESLFGLVTDTLATQFDVTISFSSAGAATATLNGVSVDFTRAGLTGNFQQIAQLANMQVQAFAAGDSSVQTDSNLIQYLLLGANETDLRLLQDELTVIEPSLHYGTAQSDAAAVQAALNDMQSCGDPTLAAVNPIVQGQCNWAKYIWREGEHLGGAQRERANGLALGHQFEVGDGLHLGFSGVYEDTRFRSVTAVSEGHRIGVGSILKLNDARSFASLSLMGSYSWADGTRTVTLPGGIGPNLTASSDHEALTFTTRLRGGHLFDLEPFDLIALAEADLAVLHNLGYTEQGAGSLNVTVAPTTNIVFDVRPAAQLGTNFSVGDVQVRAYGELGYRFSFGDIGMRTGLANGYDSTFFTNVVSHRDTSRPTYGAGLIVNLSERLEARLNYDLEQGDQDRMEKFSFKLALRF